MPEIEPRGEIVVASHKPDLILVALERGADVQTIERLVALQEKMQMREAKKEWVAAMQRAQAKMGPVRRNAKNPQTNSWYTTYDSLDEALRPHYTGEGFILSFNTGRSPLPEHMKVMCDVMHVAGFTKKYEIDVPVDGKGAKGGDVMTKPHATGSGFSYGKRYLEKGIFNIPELDERDDDGNAAGGKKRTRIAEPLLVERLTWISEAADVEALKRMYEQAAKLAESVKDNGALAQFVLAKDKRFRELRKEGTA